MRLATILDHDGPAVALLGDGGARRLDLAAVGLGSMREVAASGEAGLERIREWSERSPQSLSRPSHEIDFGPLLPDPGAIYTVGLNYSSPETPDDAGPERPLIYGKSPASVAGHGSVLAWDRSLTDNVDPECELGVVIGRPAAAVRAEDAMDHVFGYTIINDISSRDAWLDGDQWLIGKSFDGFCPVGPMVATPGELDPENLGLGCTINGVAIQDGKTSQMHHGIADVISFLSRHVTLRSGDLIATGTPARLAAPLGPDRHLEPGDEVTAWIEGLGELSTTIA